MSKYETTIYELVRSSKCHPTAEEVYAELKKEYKGVVLATVYNNLNKLVQSGKLRRITSENAPDRYDNTTRHDHVICSRCGKLSDAYLNDITDALEKQLESAVQFYDLKIYSLCEKCRGEVANKI